MVPIRPSDASLGVSNIVGNKHAQPPHPEGPPPNPSLVKALDAVIAAGRRGLLGPAGRVAAESVPALNVDPARVDKRKKVVNQKRTAVITVECSAEGIANLQPAPKEIWICGNSVISTLEKRAQSHPHGLQLGISTSRAHVFWRGIPSMRWNQLMPLLHEIYHLRSPPSVIIIHLGEDDLYNSNNTSFIISVRNDLGILKRAFPDTVIVWSSLLPRYSWRENQKPQCMELVQKDINKIMVNYCNKIGVHFLSHNLITSDKANLFLPDVNDLSDEGADIFIADLKKVLRLYEIMQ
ncbi:uncharacterized protein LOC120301171 [Crotalus tigris]|uniref:uncharacterized protein LOC120301171 n=1 Tax=Crotalus tigris TaxID=88082 RepID=UPI00192F9623|nr:uncharacterized protein LOC120301171 [Crotalus tigris]